MKRPLRRARGLAWAAVRRLPAPIPHYAALAALRSSELRRAADARGGPRADEHGVPIPPARLRVLVTHGPAAEDFLRAGLGNALMIRELVEAAGLTLSELRVLDFGCGCGRIARHMLPLVRELHGIDPNRRSVAWCARNLSNGTFLAGGREPTLPFPDGRFDLVWAWSVFTHLPAVSQRPWLAELTRIVAPGGLILFTTHGPPRAGDLRPELKAVFDRGELVVRFDEAPGTNLCAVYHPRQYVVGELLAGLELVRTFAPEQEPERAAAFRVMQDVYLARKRR